MIIVTLLLLLFIIIFINLGRFVDVTQNPVKSDIIVALGGGTGFRIKSAWELYETGFSRSDKLFHTGNESTWRNNFLLDNGIDKKNIIYIDVITNTMEEIFFIKEYMLKHNLKSVIFVSDPFHSRRISVLVDTLADYDDLDLHYTVVGTTLPWWNKNHYYHHRGAIKHTLLEIAKLCYNLLKYNFFVVDYTEYHKKKNSEEWKNALNLNSTKG